MEAATRKVPRHDGSAESRTRAARHQDTLGAARPQTGGVEESLPPLPQRGERFTEDQMRERFGVSKGGGIRESSTSSDIILVRNVRGDYDGVEEGGRIIYDSRYYKGRPDQMILDNLKLARSRESGSRVLYFVKECGSLVFSGLVECVARRYKDTPTRPGALAFELERIDPAGAAAGRQGARGGAPSSREPSVPDLDMIMAVESQISDRGSIAGRPELLAALPMCIDSANLDRILEYLERSAKISTDGGAIRWAFGDAGLQGSKTSKKDGSPQATSATAEGTVHILSREERRSADLDNDLPYSEEIERMIADCEAGRPIGETYTAEEYMRHLEHEFGIGTVDHAGK